MREFAPIDVAVLPVGGWGPRLPSDHLNPLSAAKALQLLRPRACVPVHWGTIYPPWLPPAFNAKWGEWPHAFARYAAHLAPDVDVRVRVAPRRRRPCSRRRMTGGRRRSE